MKLGTARIEAVLAQLNHPQDRINAIHVVGTNGKGSTSAMLSSIYAAQGYRTGLFTSPHLIEVTERIQVQNQPLSQADFLSAARAVYQAMMTVFPNPKDGLTYFEFINAMAFWWFAHINVDVAIVEAGLGGRLDSTNVMSRPMAVLVTPISLDHTERLGSTIDAIAWEKAGVFKPDCPVYSAIQHPQVMTVLRQEAGSVGCSLLMEAPQRVKLGKLSEVGESCTRKVVDEQTGRLYSLALLGQYQQVNLSLVLTVIEQLMERLPVRSEAISEGLASVYWPGRMTYYPRLNLLIDGSHNPAGITSLLDTIASDFPEKSIFWGVTLLANRPKEWLMPLLNYSKTVSIAFLQPVQKKQYHHSASLSAFSRETVPNISIAEELSLDRFCKSPVESGQMRILTGSLYTAGAALAMVGRR